MKRQPEYIEMSGWGTLAICGVAGSGKTSTAKYLLAQCLLNGFRVYVSDPHGNFQNGSLASSLEGIELNAPIAIEKSDRIALLEYMHIQLQARINGLKDRQHLVLFMDEVPAHFIECTREEVTKQANWLLNITNQGRKFGVHVILLGQNWKQDYAGSRSIRSSVTHIIFHRVSPDEVKLFLSNIPSDITRRISNLRDGEIIVYPGFKRMKVPYVTDDDLQNTIRKFAPVSAPDYNAEVHSARKITEPLLKSKKVHRAQNVTDFVEQVKRSIDLGMGKEEALKIILDTYKSSRNKKWLSGSKAYDKIRELYLSDKA